MRTNRHHRRPHASLHLLGLVGAAAVLVLVAGACGSDDSSTTAAAPTNAPGGVTGELEGSWTLESYTLDGAEVAAQAPAATIAFAADGTFQGTSPCNGMSGTWTDDDGTLTLALGPMTMMACADPALQAQETAITTAFGKVDAATVTAESLELTGDGVAFRFVPGPEGIVGSYLVTGVNNGAGGVESNAVTETMTAEFATDGWLRGFDGCNRWGASYRVDGASLTFGPEYGGETAACRSDAAEIAMQLFRDAVLATASWERNGHSVTLRDADGTTMVILVPAG